MPLLRAIARVLQRTDAIDFNRSGESALTNLEIAIRHGFLPQPPAILRGGTVRTDSGLFVRVNAFAGLTTAGRLAILESDTAVGPLATNSSGNPRIDLVSAYVTDVEVSAEPRVFLNNGVTPATQYTQDVATKIESRVILRVTTGTPAPTPVAPAVPSGDIALAEVRVASGATSIAAGDITQRFEVRLVPQRVQTTADAASNVALPWESDRLKSVVTPAGAVTVFDGQVQLNPLNISADTTMVLEVVNKSNANAVVAQASYGIIATVNPLNTYRVTGAVTGPIGPADYVLRLRLGNNAAGTTWDRTRNVILVARTF